MIIKWFGQNCIQIKSRDRIVVIDPFSEKIGLKMPALKADILAVTKESSEIDRKKVRSRKGNTLFTIDGPGEYEAKEVMVKGIQAKKTTIYTIYSENISVAHLGNLTEKELNDQQLDELNKVDILLIPVGGKNSLKGEEAVDLSQQIEPKIVIPIFYQLKGLKKRLDSVKGFLKIEGAEKIEPERELNISRAKLPKEETEIKVLKP